MLRVLAGVFLLLMNMSFMHAAVKERELIFELAGGYRHDQLRWSISGHNKHPDVLSELKWKNLKIAQIMATTKVVTCDSIYMRAIGSYGKIYHGRNSDQDFLEDHRKKLFSDTVAKADKGEVLDFSGGIGYHFTFLCDRATISPIGGYAYSEQHLRQYDLFVIFDALTFEHGPVPGLHSNYRTHWAGPWLGADFTLRMTRELSLFGTGEYHWIRYWGSGHWNLRPDFVKDFKHRASGWGQVYKLGMNYDFPCSHWSIGIVGNYQIWLTHSGRNRQFFHDCHAETRLNPVHWHTYSVMGQVKYLF